MSKNNINFQNLPDGLPEVNELRIFHLGLMIESKIINKESKLNRTIHYYKNGNLKVILHSKNLNQWKIKVYRVGSTWYNKGLNNNGRIIRHGKQLHYYENGKLMVDEIFKDGKPDGKFKTYHDNGYLKSEGEWVIGKNGWLIQKFEK